MPNLRPEFIAPPKIFYGIDEAKKYTKSPRIESETKLTERAIELLNITNEPSSQLILDVGCGSGISGETLTETGYGWIGVDISSAMLDLANEKDVEGGLVETDIGDGLPFRESVFDGCIGISTLQWLCFVSQSDHNPVNRIKKFFSSLIKVLKIGSRAIFQINPNSPEQVELLTKCALKAGFTGGVVVDYPNSTKAKKIFLCLSAGYHINNLPVALEGRVDDNMIQNISAGNTKRASKAIMKKPPKKSRQWIIEKKTRLNNKGVETRHHSKYTGRNRKPKF